MVASARSSDRGSRELGRELKRLRAGLTLGGVAELSRERPLSRHVCPVSPSTLSLIEQGVALPSLDTLHALARLLRVDVDCDRDALKFTVRQAGSGFCHTGTRGCWTTPFGLDAVERTVTERLRSAPPDSGTAKLLADPELLAAKLREEAEELARAESPASSVHETADVLYLAVVANAARGGTLSAVRRELELRSLRQRRRPMVAKQGAGGGER